MKWIFASLSRFLGNDWRELADAPCNRAIEVAVIDGDDRTIRGVRLRHGNDWLDAETLRPVETVATHWRYRVPLLPWGSCC